MRLRQMAAPVLTAFLIAPTQAAGLSPALTGLDFLLGRWSSDNGKVAETGGSSKGSSQITAEVGGNVLLRRDHTELFDAAGKPSGGFDQLMMIYPEGGTLHADYCDGKHVIHYDSAVVVAGHSVTFTSVHQAGAPTFRLSYELGAPAALTVTFSIAPPGQAEFHPIASGTLKKAG